MKTLTKKVASNIIAMFIVTSLFIACKKNKSVDVPLTLKFTGTANLSEARDHLVAASAGGKLFFAGGYGNNYSGVVDIYNASTNQWSSNQLSVQEDI